jgi:hypothetical protein
VWTTGSSCTKLAYCDCGVQNFMICAKLAYSLLWRDKPSWLDYKQLVSRSIITRVQLNYLVLRSLMLVISMVECHWGHSCWWSSWWSVIEFSCVGDIMVGCHWGHSCWWHHGGVSLISHVVMLVISMVGCHWGLSCRWSAWWSVIEVTHVGDQHGGMSP